MRHRKSFNHLGRKTAHRSAMLANMASSLILHKRIETTVAKAKALRGYVEPLITKSKDDTTHSRRTVFSYLQNKEAVTELFREVSVKVADRPGGYLRLLKIGSRLGDNAEMCIVELVDYNENLLGDAAAEKAKAGRRRRGARKKTSEQQKVVAEAAPEKVVNETEVVSEEAITDADIISQEEEVVEEGNDEEVEVEAEDEAEDEAEVEVEAEDEAEVEAEVEAEDVEIVNEVAEEKPSESAEESSNEDADTEKK